MIVLQLLIMCSLACRYTQGRVLNDIVDILAENPRTRSLFLRTIATHKYPQRRIRYVRPLDQRYLYALTRPMPALIPNTITNGAVDQPLSSFNDPLNRPALPCSTNPQQPKCSENQNQDASGVALDINGDMKQNIPYKIVTTAPIMTEIGPAGVKGTPFQDNRAASEELFQKKRTIIKELKSLFRVILNGDITSNVAAVRPLRIRTPLPNRERPVNEAAVKTGKVMAVDHRNTSSVSPGAKRGRISFSPKRQKGNKRVVLYRKLINDLNDLITLEINKNNKTNTFEGVEQLAPSKLRSTISRTSTNVVEE